MRHRISHLLFRCRYRWKSQDLPWGRQLAAYYITESPIEE